MSDLQFRDLKTLKDSEVSEINLVNRMLFLECLWDIGSRVESLKTSILRQAKAEEIESQFCGLESQVGKAHDHFITFKNEEVFKKGKLLK